MAVEFKKLQTLTLKEKFITQMEEMIISGQFEIGQKLPSERELSQKMGISRAVVNSGIAEMARKGFIEVRPRVGNFVADYRKNGIDRLYADCRVLLDYICSGQTENAVARRLKYTE